MPKLCVKIFFQISVFINLNFTDSEWGFKNFWINLEKIYWSGIYDIGKYNEYFKDTELSSYDLNVSTLIT